MRTPLAVVILVSSAFALAMTAAADRPNQRNDKAGRQADAPKVQYTVSPKEVCEERARAEDPTGAYASFPCWAREAFGRGSQGSPVQR
jgi:hypothetical protein